MSKHAQCRLTSEQYDTLQDLAEKNRVKVADIFRWALLEYMDNHAEKL